MYRTLSDRQAGNLYGPSSPFFLLKKNCHSRTIDELLPTSHTQRLDFWETSRDEMTGAIRFRRKTQLVNRTPGLSGDSASTTGLQMARRGCPPPQPEERYMERFEAHDIALDDESESMGEGNRGIAMGDDKSETVSVHAM